MSRMERPKTLAPILRAIADSSAVKTDDPGVG
jgi:hypothetical protein